MGISSGESSHLQVRREAKRSGEDPWVEAEVSLKDVQESEAFSKEGAAYAAQRCWRERYIETWNALALLRATATVAR